MSIEVNNRVNECISESNNTVDQSNNLKSGYISIYMGCMYSGKTTNLIKEVALYTEMTKSTGLLVNHYFDTRDLDNKISTHNKLISKITHPLYAVYSQKLSEISESVLQQYSIIGIDEAQFFVDLYETVLKWVSAGKYIVISGLSGTYKKELFGELYRLISHADKIEFLQAICKECTSEVKNNFLTPELLNTMKAPFTKKITGNYNTTVEIGSTDKYIPVCRKHYNCI
jgi:thymidine kinase